MSKSAIVLCLLVTACSAAPYTRLHGLRPILDGRIVGGEPVDISQYPWQISLQALGYHSCGGSIIGSMWVLTAEHCILGARPDILAVRAGTSTRNSGGSVFDVVSVIEHKSYDSVTKDYDFGILQISGPFSFDNNVQTITLGSTELAAGTSVTITGWGALWSGGDIPTQLQAVSTSIVGRLECNEAYGGAITERMICAGEAEGGKNSCQGDSGGPLVVGNTQYGVVSWAEGCAEEGYPGVFSNVPAVRAWINDVTGV